MGELVQTLVASLNCKTKRSTYIYEVINLKKKNKKSQYLLALLTNFSVTASIKLPVITTIDYTAVVLPSPVILRRGAHGGSWDLRASL